MDRTFTLPTCTLRPWRPDDLDSLVGLDSVKEEMNSFEPLFHARGMATLTFDGPGQGESTALPIEPAFEKAVSVAKTLLPRVEQALPTT